MVETGKIRPTSTPATRLLQVCYILVLSAVLTVNPTVAAALLTPAKKVDEAMSSASLAGGSADT